MGNRFSEIANAKWCKLCNVNVIEGSEHPDENAHLVAQLEQIKKMESDSIVAKKLTATSSLIPVSSNDMLKHISQIGSPETLCGRLITDKYRPSTTDLVCDVCADLAGSTSFIVESEEPSSLGQVTATNYTRDGFKIDDDGFTVLTNDNENDLFSGFTFDKFINTSAFEFGESDSSEEPVEEITYLGTIEDEEPIQFTAHWLQEDDEEPLFLPHNEF